MDTDPAVSFLQLQKEAIKRDKEERYGPYTRIHETLLALVNSVETMKMEVLQETIKELQDAMHAVREEVTQLKQACPRRESKLEPCWRCGNMGGGWLCQRVPKSQTPRLSGEVKLENPAVAGQTLVIVGDSLAVVGQLNGQKVDCLVDTGSQVTTMDKDYLLSHFPDVCNEYFSNWIFLTPANHLPIPVVGVAQMDI